MNLCCMAREKQSQMRVLSSFSIQRKKSDHALLYLSLQSLSLEKAITCLFIFTSAAYNNTSKQVLKSELVVPSTNSAQINDWK